MAYENGANWEGSAQDTEEQPVTWDTEFTSAVAGAPAGVSPAVFTIRRGESAGTVAENLKNAWNNANRNAGFTAEIDKKKDPLVRWVRKPTTEPTIKVSRMTFLVEGSSSTTLPAPDPGQTSGALVDVVQGLKVQNAS